VILKWLDLKGYEVIAFVADLGQREDLQTLEEKAKKSGAKEYIYVGLKGRIREGLCISSSKV